MNKKINEVLTDIRKKHKLTRKGLENISGFKVSRIESYERGNRVPSNDYIEFISLYFGYSMDFINDKTKTILNDFIRVINMFQSIYNYDNEYMSKLLNITKKEYEKKYYYLTKENLVNKNLDDIFLIIEKLNIKPSCVNLILRELETKKIHFKKDIENLEKRFLKLENLGINITPEYYAQIIKERNNPKTVTPDTRKEDIPEKYKEILELLPYAPDSFLNTIIQKLKTIKETQIL